ncbi:MAG: transcriptional regulator [Ignavibacteria bacterium]|nr:MAG: transcriptional regulator [Ignavibacteria bacterium]
MKFSSQEEYGLRCLLQLARQGEGLSMTISGISDAEGLSQAYVAKLLRILRLNGFVASVRGQEGGYTLARPPADIVLSEVLAALGGQFYKPGFCDHYAGTEDKCAHTFSCSIRPLWHRVQVAIDSVLERTTLDDLVEGEQTTSWPGRQVIPRDRVQTL